MFEHRFVELGVTSSSIKFQASTTAFRNVYYALHKMQRLVNLYIVGFIIIITLCAILISGISFQYWLNVTFPFVINVSYTFLCITWLLLYYYYVFSYHCALYPCIFKFSIIAENPVCLQRIPRLWISSIYKNCKIFNWSK